MFDNLVGTSYSPQVAAKNAIIDELRAAGASDNLIGGIMANVKDESGFNPGLRHPDQPRWGGEAHYAHGLYQEGGQEWLNYDNWLKKNYPGQSWTDPVLQTRFLGQNLKENYPSVWSTMNSVRSPEEAAQAFVTGYLKPREDFRLQRVAAYGRGVPGLDSYVPGAGTPENMSQDDQFARAFGANEAAPASEPSTEDRLASALTGERGTGTSMPPVIQIQQQRAQTPALDDLTNEAPGYRKLAEALMSSGRSMGQSARSPWEALGALAQIASGTYQDERAREADKDYTARLMSALQGGGGDTASLARVLIANPETRSAGLTALVQAAGPKSQEWVPLPAQTDAYGRPTPPQLVNKHSGEVRAVGSGVSSQASPSVTSSTPPATSPVSAQSPSAPNPFLGGSPSSDEYDWVRSGVPKMPEGTVQLSDPQKGWAYYKGTSVPVPESKSGQAVREKSDEKEREKALASIETAQKVNNVYGLLDKPLERPYTDYFGNKYNVYGDVVSPWFGPEAPPASSGMVGQLISGVTTLPSAWLKGYRNFQGQKYPEAAGTNKARDALETALVGLQSARVKELFGSTNLSDADREAAAKTVGKLTTQDANALKEQLSVGEKESFTRIQEALRRGIISAKDIPADVVQRGLSLGYFGGAPREQSSAQSQPDQSAAPPQPKMQDRITQQSAPPQRAIDALKANPSLRDQFDAKYGAGASAAILGR